MRSTAGFFFVWITLSQALLPDESPCKPQNPGSRATIRVADAG